MDTTSDIACGHDLIVYTSMIFWYKKSHEEVVAIYKVYL